MSKQKMKMKLWKKILLILIVILLAIAAYVIYIFQFKEYDTADSEVTEITRETFKIELPDGSSIALDEDGNVIESDKVETNSTGNSASNSSQNENSSDTSFNTNEESLDTINSTDAAEDESSTVTSSGTSSNSGETSGSNSGSKGSTEGATGNNTDSTDKSGEGSSSDTGGSSGNGSKVPPGNSATTTVASIKEKYNPVMASLQDQASSRIDSLVGRAYKEYQVKQTNGETINYAYFYNKYTSAAAELESRTDKVFYQVVAVIEKELEANDFSKTHAQTFIDEYNAEKEDRRNALLDRALNK